MTSKGILAVIAVLAIGAYSASMASGASFTAEKYPVSITGSSTSDTFDFLGTTVPCETTLTGSLAAASEELVLTPSFKCTFFGGPLPFTTAPEALKLTADGTLHLTKELRIDLFSSGGQGTCVVDVKPGTSSVSVTNNSPNIRITGEPQFSYTHTRLSIICPAGNEGTIFWTIQPLGISLRATSEGVPTPMHVK
jgi:hypothetical protein